tara:strand:- start:3453 stop:3821 length:369 start_codon:yes stop_codon:yes gene_type:complete
MKAKQSKWSFIYDIEVKDKRNYTRTLYVTKTPYSNCQLFTIGSIHGIMDATDSSIIELFETIYKTLTTKQLLSVDVTKENLKRVKERLKLVSSRIIQKKYTSPNGSIMYECKIYLNKKKYLK